MITPRILFTDAAAAAPWVGLAKQLGRQTYDAGIISKTFVVADGVKIIVKNVLAQGKGFGSGMGQDLGGICKVWIEARESFGYQFLCTGISPVLNAFLDIGFMMLGGSGVFVPLPKVEVNKQVDFTKSVPVATGSTIEGDDESPWKVNPLTYDGIIASQKFKTPVQVQLVPESTFYKYSNLGLNVNKKPSAALSYAWVSQQGQIRSAGSYQPVNPFFYGDILYDSAPTPIKGTKGNPRVPDADWYQDAGYVTIEDSRYGARTFIVMADASSVFHCWPSNIMNDPSKNPDYVPQSIKTNIDPENARSFALNDIENLPNWVYKPEGSHREYYRVNGTDSKEPRYPWVFHPTDARVVGMAVDRESTAYKVYRQNWNPDKSESDPRDYLPEFDDGPPILFSGDEIKWDIPGWIELSIDISLTGTKDNEFNFSMSVLRHHKNEAENFVIAAGYVNPISSGWIEKGFTLNAGDLVTAELELRKNAEYIDIEKQECGSRISSDESVEQVKLLVRSQETSDVVLTIPLAYNPDRYGQYQWNDGYFSIKSTIEHINLADLSFFIRYVGEDHVVDTEEYGVVDSYSGDLRKFSSADAKITTIKTGCEIVLRSYMHGKKVLDRSVGLDLGTAALIDSVWPNDSTVIYLEDTSTKWLGQAPVFLNSNISNKKHMFTNNHWLLDKIFYSLEAYLDIDPASEILTTPSTKEEFDLCMENWLDDIGGHLVVKSWNQEYTFTGDDNYWDRVKDIAWNVYNTAPSSVSYVSFYTKLRQLRSSVAPASYVTEDYLFDGYPRIYNYDIGKHTFYDWWYLLCKDVGKHYYFSNHPTGFFGVYIPSAWTTERVTTRLRFIDSSNNQPVPVFCYSTATVPELCTNLVYREPSAIPNEATIASEVFDIIGHVDSSSTYSHLSAYNTAYKKDPQQTLSDYAPKFRIEESLSASIGEDDSIELTPSGRIAYIYDWIYNVDGVNKRTGFYPTETIPDPVAAFQILDHPSFYRVPFDLHGPRCNGSWMFV